MGNKPAELPVAVEYAVLSEAVTGGGAAVPAHGETSPGIDRSDDRFKDLPRDAWFLMVFVDVCVFLICVLLGFWMFLVGFSSLGCDIFFGLGSFFSKSKDATIKEFLGRWD